MSENKCLLHAKWVEGTKIQLIFSDGLRKIFDLTKLSLKLSLYKLPTAKASVDGEFLELDTADGRRTASISAEIIKYFCEDRKGEEFRRRIE